MSKELSPEHKTLIEGLIEKHTNGIDCETCTFFLPNEEEPKYRFYKDYRKQFDNVTDNVNHWMYYPASPPKQ